MKNFHQLPLVPGASLPLPVPPVTPPPTVIGKAVAVTGIAVAPFKGPGPAV